MEKSNNLIWKRDEGQSPAVTSFSISSQKTERSTSKDFGETNEWCRKEKKPDLTELRSPRHFTKGFMYITHLFLIPTQEHKFRGKLKWVKVFRSGSNPSLSDPVQIPFPYLWNVNNSLDIMLQLNLSTW